MGLAAAYQAVRDGHEVSVLESSDVAGGMAAHFDFGGLSIERFYHFVCRADFATFELLNDLGISDQLHWRPTSMGFFFGGHLHTWGDPVSLLKLPNTSLMMKLRYGLFAFVCTRMKKWPSLENRSAKDWIISWCGEAGYNRFWRSLLDYKFYEEAQTISAAWIWTRIRRVGLSRKNMMQEEMGYIEGGSQTLVQSLLNAIEAAGGEIHLSAPALHVRVNQGKAVGVETATNFFPADHVISTIPTPFISRMVPDLSAQTREKYDAIRNIGICCVVLKLKRSISRHFWVNIEESEIDIPGVIEFTNLREFDPTVVYVPYYMPVSNEKYTWSDDALVADAMRCLKRLNTELEEDDLIESRVARLPHAQPICQVGFASRLPAVQTEITGLQIADTCFYYPEDRSISESVRLGRSMARTIS